jgi:hypothetical protein
MPRPLPPGGVRRRAVPLRLSADEEHPWQVIADEQFGGNLSAAIRAGLEVALAAHTYCEVSEADPWDAADEECAKDALFIAYQAIRCV